ncbi:protein STRICTOSIDINE SYNTHASE-LIKE 12-like [Humulus lupulus]|uniref:protein STRICTOSIDINE SYNTHASE-LIKE 12-like n=1 Tax=Humulus lupulus TaxID=3486 RepID=UPI002B412D35|nr:protein STRICTOSIDINE SYNTHASE-LIKE 12-like [Humulus lupulus]
MNTIILFFLFLSSSSIHTVLSRSLFNFQKLDLPSTSVGPDSITFDSFGRGPYTGISDGRIVKYNTSYFVEVYITSPHRTSSKCDGTDNPAILGPICGRPKGLDFYYKEKKLYIADAYKGFLVGEKKRLAVPLATGAEGVPFKFLSGLNVDQLTGDVYFADASSVFQLSQITAAVLANDRTGRLLKYSHRTKQVSVLLRRLGGAVGVALSSDGSFVLVSEYIAKRIIKFWLRGPMAFKSQVILNLQGNPTNIKRTQVGDSFWVAVNKMSLGLTVPIAININENGVVLRTIPLDRYYFNTTISEFSQRGSNFYVGSLQADFVGVLKK